MPSLFINWLIWNRGHSAYQTNHRATPKGVVRLERVNVDRLKCEILEESYAIWRRFSIRTGYSGIRVITFGAFEGAVIYLKVLTQQKCREKLGKPGKKPQPELRIFSIVYIIVSRITAYFNFYPFSIFTKCKLKHHLEILS